MAAGGRFGFTFPDGDDYYDISEYNGNMRIIEQNAVNGAGVMTVRALTEAEYDSITEKNQQTLYLVINSTTFSAYLGEIPLKREGSALIETATFNLSGGLGAMIGIIETEE